jgi:hypothetical protein
VKGQNSVASKIVSRRGAKKWGRVSRWTSKKIVAAAAARQD